MLFAIWMMIGIAICTVVWLVLWRTQGASFREDWAINIAVGFFASLLWPLLLAGMIGYQVERRLREP